MGENQGGISRLWFRSLAVKNLRRLFADAKGATAVEYGLICALIALVIISALTALGPTIETQMMNVEKAIAAPTP